jgi:uncharacterized protein (DUF1501 family)
MLDHPCRSLSRREALALSAAGIAGASVSGWLGLLAQHAARAAAPPTRRKSCILLWMDGGPSHHDTFDPKPDASAEVCGPLGSIATALPGVRVTEKFPKTARLLKHAALLRGMCTDEADHARARVYVHTGYKPGAGGLVYPGLGSTVSAELGRPDAPMPSFVVTGTPLNKHAFLGDPGWRGPRHQPLVVADPARGLDHLRPFAGVEDFDDRAALLDQLEGRFARTYKGDAAETHRTALRRAVALMRSDKAHAFDLSREPDTTRRAYGESKFGQGCLLARRLVEAGVSFVEVYLQNWDTHEKKVFDDALGLMAQVDDGMSALVTDLAERGMLDSTLVVWMGEFGRTRMNRNGGRDHHSRAWTSMLLGGGIRGGQVIGRTDAQGVRVEDRPISIKDFMATVCRVLGIDPERKISTPIGRPIRIVDEGGQAIREVLG